MCGRGWRKAVGHGGKGKHMKVYKLVKETCDLITNSVSHAHTIESDYTHHKTTVGKELLVHCTSQEGGTVIIWQGSRVIACITLFQNKRN